MSIENPVDPSIPPPDFQKEISETEVKKERSTTFGPRRWSIPIPTPETQGLPADSWIKTKWRPFMAWQYFFVCLFDFIGGPIANMIYFSNNPDEVFNQWVPLTLTNGGLYHVSMGLIIGVYAYQRTKEKEQGVA